MEKSLGNEMETGTLQQFAGLNVAQDEGTLMGVLIVIIIVLWGLYWGLPIYANCHLRLHVIVVSVQSPVTGLYNPTPGGSNGEYPLNKPYSGSLFRPLQNLFQEFRLQLDAQFLGLIFFCRSHVVLSAFRSSWGPA